MLPDGEPAADPSPRLPGHQLVLVATGRGNVSGALEPEPEIPGMMIGPSLGDLSEAMVMPMEGCPAGMVEVRGAGICVPSIRRVPSDVVMPSGPGYRGRGPTEERGRPSGDLVFGRRTRTGWERRGLLSGLGQVCIRVCEDPECYGSCLEYDQPIGPEPSPESPPEPPGGFGDRNRPAVCVKGTLGDQLCSQAEIRRGVSDKVLTWGGLAIVGFALITMMRS